MYTAPWTNLNLLSDDQLARLGLNDETREQVGSVRPLTTVLELLALDSVDPALVRQLVAQRIVASAVDETLLPPPFPFSARSADRDPACGEAPAPTPLTTPVGTVAGSPLTVTLPFAFLAPPPLPISITLRVDGAPPRLVDPATLTVNDCTTQLPLLQIVTGTGEADPDDLGPNRLSQQERDFKLQTIAEDRAREDAEDNLCTEQLKIPIAGFCTDPGCTRPNHTFGPVGFTTITSTPKILLGAPIPVRGWEATVAATRLVTVKCV